VGREVGDPTTHAHHAESATSATPSCSYPASEIVLVCRALDRLYIREWSGRVVSTPLPASPVSAASLGTENNANGVCVGISGGGVWWRAEWSSCDDSPAPNHPPPPRPNQTHTLINLRLRLPRNNFKLCFTPVSRCFSSFPHGTCALSVSRPYLALEDVYPPTLCAALTSNATLGTAVVLVCKMLPFSEPERGCHPLRRPIPRDLVRRNALLLRGARHDRAVSRPQLAVAAWDGDSQLELFPLHSPLLGKSSLVSFPPLNNMLKFSGCSYLI